MSGKVDVVIIGGGPAGLNAALVLGRARKSVIVIDDLQPRNIVTRETHGFLTRDGASPREFRKAAHKELAAYPSVNRASDTASAVTGKDGAFEITTVSGAVYSCKKLLFAVGKRIFRCPLTDSLRSMAKAPLSARIVTAGSSGTRSLFSL